MSFLPFDSEAVSVSHFAAALMPQMVDVATAVGCHQAILARATAVKLYRQGLRTSTIGDLRIACRIDNPIPAPLDDGPGPGCSVDLQGRAA